MRVHAVPLRKVIYELSPYYCLIACKQEGGQREHGNALTSLCLCLSLFASLSLSVFLSMCLVFGFFSLTLNSLCFLIPYCCHTFYCCFLLTWASYLTTLTRILSSSHGLSHPLFLSLPPFSSNFHTPGYLQLHPWGTNRGKQVNHRLTLGHHEEEHEQHPLQHPAVAPHCQGYDRRPWH